MVWSGGDAGGGVRVFHVEAEAGLGAQKFYQATYIKISELEIASLLRLLQKSM